MQDYPGREVSHEYVRCGNDAPCTVASDLRARVRELEAAVENWMAIIADEMAENVKLFDLLGVMPAIEAGGAGTDAVVDAVQRLYDERATTQAELAKKQRALKDIRGLLVVRPHRFADQTEKIHAVIDDVLGSG